MVYFGENNEYILCECEVCKKEMYIERSAVSEEDAYAYHLFVPIKCPCGAIDEYINRAKKSCHNIKQELASLSDLLRKQTNISNRIADITAELNKKFEPPSFFQSVGKDILFSLKVFLILLGSVVGLEIFLFVISCLLFFIAMPFGMLDLQRAANELFYNINIFKDYGGHILSKFGMAPTYSLLSAELSDKEIIVDYIPYALAGAVLVVFYVFLAVLVVRMAVSVAKLTFFASKVANQKIRIATRKEEYRRQLDDLGLAYQNIADQIDEAGVLPPDYKTSRATDTILRYFINNRIDTVREALNLFHEEEFRNRQLEYEKALYNEARQTRRYTKALYMVTSDENIKVDVKEVREDLYENEDAKVAEIMKDAFAKIKKSSKVSRLPPPSTQSAIAKKMANAPNAAASGSDRGYSGETENSDNRDNGGDRDNDNEDGGFDTPDEDGEDNFEKTDLKAIFDDPPSNDEK